MSSTANNHRSPRRGAVALAAVLAGTLGLAGLLTACSTTQPASTQLNDTAIATKVKAKLTADPEINPFKIDVDVNEGVVRLSGTVEQAKVRTEAERLARDTEGVVRVQNDLQLGERSLGERAEDAVITAKVKAKLAADPQINALNINVDTEDGVVTLTGRVRRAVAKTEAEKLARDTDGVRRVRNQIQVGELDERSEERSDDGGEG